MHFGNHDTLILSCHIRTPIKDIKIGENFLVILSLLITSFSFFIFFSCHYFFSSCVNLTDFTQFLVIGDVFPACHHFIMAFQLKSSISTNDLLVMKPVLYMVYFDFLSIDISAYHNRFQELGLDMSIPISFRYMSVFLFCVALAFSLNKRIANKQ